MRTTQDIRTPRSTSFAQDVAAGKVPKHSFATTIGSNPAACTKYEDIWDVGELDTLDYDAQTSDFTPGLVVTGASSRANARLVADDDSGTTGTLTLRRINGEFNDNEIITDTGGGSATIDGELLGTHKSLIYATAGEQWEVLCESPFDTLAGTGAQKITITYLDANYVEQTTTVNLSGPTASLTTPTDCLRFQSAVVSQFGSGSSSLFLKCNTGGILIRDVATKNPLGFIPYDDSVSGDAFGLNTTRSIHYTVRAGERAYIYEVTVNTSKNFEADVFSAVRFFGQDAFIPLAQRFIYQGSILLPLSASPLTAPAKTDLKLVGRSSTVGVPISVTIIYLVVKD